MDACFRHRVPFCWRTPGTLLVSATGAQAVLADLLQQGHRVLRYEGFEVEGRWIHPRLDLIYDAEGRPDITDPIDPVRGWPRDIWIDIVIAKSPQSGD